MLGEHRVRDGLRIQRERVRAGAGRPVAPAGGRDRVPTAGRSRSLAPAQRHHPGLAGDHRSRPVVAREKRLERGLETLASVLGDGPERGCVRPPVDEDRLHGIGHLRARHRRHPAARPRSGSWGECECISQHVFPTEPPAKLFFGFRVSRAALSAGRVGHYNRALLESQTQPLRPLVRFAEFWRQDSGTNDPAAHSTASERRKAAESNAPSGHPYVRVRVRERPAL